MARREPIKGRLGAGTDALFSSSGEDVMSTSVEIDPALTLHAGMPVKQGTNLEVNQQDGSAGHQSAGSPVIQQDSVLAQQPTVSPATQRTGRQTNQRDAKTARQQTRNTANQQISSEVSQRTDKPIELVKATFYLTPDLVMKLEELRLARLRKGQRIDKSALVREALDRLTG